MSEKCEEFLVNQQFGFRKNKGTVDAMFILRQLMELGKGKKSQSSL